MSETNCKVSQSQCMVFWQGMSTALCSTPLTMWEFLPSHSSQWDGLCQPLWNLLWCKVSQTARLVSCVQVGVTCRMPSPAQFWAYQQAAPILPCYFFQMFEMCLKVMDLARGEDVIKWIDLFFVPSDL